MRDEFNSPVSLRIVGGTLYCPEAVVEADVNVEEEELDIKDLSLEDLIALAKDVAEAIEEKESGMKKTLIDLLEDGIVTILWTNTDGQKKKSIATRCPEIVNELVGGIPEIVAPNVIWVWNCLIGRAEAIPFESIDSIMVREPDSNE